MEEGEGKALKREVRPNDVPRLFFTTSSFIWYENNSESANSKFRFGDCRRTT